MPYFHVPDVQEPFCWVTLVAVVSRDPQELLEPRLLYSLMSRVEFMMIEETSLILNQAA